MTHHGFCGAYLHLICCITEGKGSVYDTSLFAGIISELEEISGRKYEGDSVRDFRIIADHLRAATFILGDGVVPAKVGQGYILRRLIRRAARNMSKLGYDDIFMDRVCTKIIDQYGEAYPELIRERENICRNIKAEEEKFHSTLVKGLRRFNEVVDNAGDAKVLDGELVFRLYDTFGFPVELTAELAAEKGLSVDMEDFQNRFRAHQDKSRAGSEQTFKGGLADNSEETTKLHTATHLLNAALRKLIDPDIRQKGSNITADRLRFDFNFDRKLTPEELKSIEDFVNDAIKRDIPVVCTEMPIDEAKASGAIGVFDNKYGSIVKVYTIGDVSAELCGGPHVTHTGELQGFKIKKEESSAAGVRRIKAVVGKF